MPLREPQECTSLDQVRQEIDRNVSRRKPWDFRPGG